MRKILFLDVDGVMNSKDTLQRSTRGVIGIDPYLSILVHRIVEATGCEVVLSSSWRHMGKGYEEVGSIIPLIGKTGSSDSRIRGVEIHEWLRENVEGFNSGSYKGDDGVARIAILDDDSDMLLWQGRHFFQTSFETGITEEIAAAVIKHLGEI